jgi:protein TonB
METGGSGGGVAVVERTDAMKAATSRVAPDYPLAARQMKVAGKVEVEVVIKEDGSVDAAKALTGNALLTNAAVDAAKKWKFTPFTEGGSPTTAVTVLVFNFTL